MSSATAPPPPPPPPPPPLPSDAPDRLAPFLWPGRGALEQRLGQGYSPPLRRGRNRCGLWLSRIGHRPHCHRGMQLGGVLPCPANVRPRRNRDDRLSRRRGGHSFADRRHGTRGDSVGRRNSRLGRPVLAGQSHPPTYSVPPVGVSPGLAGLQS